MIRDTCSSVVLAVSTVLWIPLLGRTGTGLCYAQTPDYSDNSTTGIIQRLLNDHNMDSRIRPNAEGEPVLVHCGVFVASFGSVSEANMDYTVTLFFRQSWQDDRMAHTHKKSISLSARGIDKVWTPDLFFPNEKQASFHVVTTPNKLMRVYPNGTIVYSVRLTLRLSCPMDLHSFPMDHQSCLLKIESYSLDSDDMDLNWTMDTPVQVNDNVELPQFDLTGIHTRECHSTYKTGEYPCLEATFELQRQFGFFLLQTYVPTILIVVLSWVSFWINMDAVPARISLGVTTVLTMTTQLSGSKGAIPRVSYPKAIDVWMSMCMIFVFTALLEYAFVNALSRKYQSRSIRLKKKNDDAKDQEDEEPPRGLQLLNIRKFMGTRQVARLLDKLSRLLFPLTFAIFNLIYWPFYLQHKFND